jgi:hypothetical protein
VVDVKISLIVIGATPVPGVAPVTFTTVNTSHVNCEPVISGETSTIKSVLLPLQIGFSGDGIGKPGFGFTVTTALGSLTPIHPFRTADTSKEIVPATNALLVITCKPKLAVVEVAVIIPEVVPPTTVTPLV